MADPDLDSGFVYNEQGNVDLLQSTFFDINPEVVASIEQYLDRTIYTLSEAKEEQLSNVKWCIISGSQSGLLEETEDELAELIKKGGLKPEQLSKVLCQDLSKHCVAHRDDDEL